LTAIHNYDPGLKGLPGLLFCYILTLYVTGMFKTGGTEELAAVVNHLTSVVKHKRLIGVGFSMGANILIKYLGEEPSRQTLFECAVSVCQGYDILR